MNSDSCSRQDLLGGYIYYLCTKHCSLNFNSINTKRKRINKINQIEGSFWLKLHDTFIHSCSIYFNLYRLGYYFKSVCNSKEF